MTYYNGDIHKLLISFYSFLSSIGYDITISGEGDDIKVICSGFSNDGKYGTGPWIYNINRYEFCSDIKEFIPCLIYTRKQNENGRDIKSHIYQYDGDKIFWKRLKLKESQWMECVLAYMMPGNIHDSIINRFESVKDDGMWDDVDRYKSLARDIKLKMILNG